MYLIECIYVHIRRELLSLPPFILLCVIAKGVLKFHKNTLPPKYRKSFHLLVLQCVRTFPPPPKKMGRENDKN